MKKSYNLLFLLVVVISCRSSQETFLYTNKSIDTISINRNAVKKESELNLLFRSIIDAEIKELGRRFAVVDRTVGPTSLEIDGFENDTPENGENIIWNRESFSQINYISGEKVIDYKRNDRKEYFKLINRYGRNGWIELHVPKFSKDRKMVLIEFNYYRGRNINKDYYYILEKQEKYYKMVKVLYLDNQGNLYYLPL